MSTPRTDELDDRMGDISPDVEQDYREMMRHARQLEREAYQSLYERNGVRIYEVMRQRDTAIRKLEEAHGVILACHRAFNGGSDFVQTEARRLAAEMVEGGSR